MISPFWRFYGYGRWAGVLALGLVLRAAEGPVPAASVATNLPPAKFRPPILVGLGLRRQVSAGSRGTDTRHVAVTALVPDGLGLSGNDQPTFFWHLDRPCTNTVVFTLNQNYQTLLKLELPPPALGGLQQFSLASAGTTPPVQLRPGVPYEWAVRVKQGDDPAEHPVSVGWVEYRPQLPALTELMKSVPPIRRADLLAGAGYWYDAVITLAPVDLQPSLVSLLRDVGLTNVVLAPH